MTKPVAPPGSAFSHGAHLLGKDIFALLVFKNN
jgi:hypothetical protein